MQQQQQQQHRRRLVCAIFGLGRAGRIHLGNLLRRPDIRLKFVVDAEPEAAGEQLNGFVEGVQLLTPQQEDRVFEDEEVDFCVVASPTYSHEAIVRKCIASRKQIFCEKPVAKSVEDLADCYRRAEEAGVVLHCSFNRRYDPSFNSLKSQIPSAVGRIFTVRTCSRDSPVPTQEYLRTSGGIFHDCGVHDFHVVSWMLDDWPQTIYATASRYDTRLKDFGDFDNAVVVMSFSEGRVAVVELSRYSTYGYDQRVEVHGSLGMLASNNVTDRAVTASTQQGVTSPKIQFSFDSRYSEAYAASLDNFVRRVRGDPVAHTVTGLDALNVSRVADACEESVRSGRVVEFAATKTL